MRQLQQLTLLTLKDLRLFVRDRGGLVFALAFPLLFAFAFSLILPDAELDATLNLYVATAEPEVGISHQIIDGLQEVPDIEVTVLTTDQAAQDLNAGDIDGYLFFPDDLTERLFQGQRSTIHVVTENGDPQRGALRREVASSIARDLSIRQAALGSALSLAIEAGQVPAEAEISQLISDMLDPDAVGPVARVGIEQVQVGDIEPVPAASYVFPGYITMFLFFAAGFGASELIRERRDHTFDRLIASGVGSSTILAGKWLGTAARAVIQATILWTAAVLFFDIDMGRAPFATILVTFAMLVASASFALFLAAIARTQQSAESITVLAALTMAALGGSWWPLFIMPDWMQTLARITPHAWANDAFNNLLLFGARTGDVLVNVGVLFAFGIAFALFAAVRLNRRDV
jgi:ABC-2 type transport system permease protein